MARKTGCGSPKRPKLVVDTGRPSRAEAEAAVRTLLRWAGDDPAREGLVDTPARVVRAYAEWFAGYDIDPEEFLRRTFKETDGYDEMVVLRDIAFESVCEHHVAPIIGGRMSPICRIRGWSEFQSLRASSRPTRSGCRSRRR